MSDYDVVIVYVTIQVIREISSSFAFANSADNGYIYNELHYSCDITSSRPNVIAYILHFNNFPLAFCHKESILRQNARQSYLQRYPNLKLLKQSPADINGVHTSSIHI